MPVTIARGLGKVSGLAYEPSTKKIYFLDYSRNSLMSVIPGQEPETLLTDLESPRQLSYVPTNR